jgi:NAD(P)-dependent dehydrogenase (short-subunit alcohol dehydrogenase family)
MRARFEGRNVIVTGAAQGIGRAIAEGFLAEGARIYACDIRGGGLERMRGESSAPERVEIAVADLGDPAGARGLVRDAVERMERVHVLVNCAGVQPDGAALDVSTEEFDTTFAVNTRGPFLTMQEVCRHFIEHGGGTIVNIASANAFRNESPEAAYNASKAALVSLTKAFAHELGHLGIRVNCVAPGETITPEAAATMTADDERREHEYLRRIPMRRAARPEEQAAAVLFLASDDASYVTGETIIVDGGELTGSWYDPLDAPPVVEMHES